MAPSSVRIPRNRSSWGSRYPLDDIAVITALKQNTQHIDRRNIVLIEPKLDVVKRYWTVFGPDIILFEGTFQEWVVDHVDKIQNKYL